MIGSDLAENISEIISGIVPAGSTKTSLHEPLFIGNEWRCVKECLDSGWVSSAGQYVDRFEKAIAQFTGAKHAIAVVNGTAALHTCLLLAGVERGDEVIVPALSFVATANAVTYCGAVPHFADSEISTLGLSPARLEDYLKAISEVRSKRCINKETGRWIKAVVPMHTFGHPVDLEHLSELCARFNLTMVEDAAESLGSYYKGRHTGLWGKLGALSFNGNKIVTTGGGGAILTDDGDIARLAKHLTATAKLQHPWAFYHDATGFNYRIPNINAALGCAQLEQLPNFLEAKRALAKHYSQALAATEGVCFFTEPGGCKSNYWLNTLLLDKADPRLRDAIIESLGERGIQARPAWTPLHRLPMHASCPRTDLSVAEDLEARIINIPSSARLGMELLIKNRLPGTTLNRQGAQHEGSHPGGW
ncbi:MAG: LegC family aminotransferase [Syntrophobacteraceae bacterium]